MVLERSIYSDFVFLEAMYNQGFIRKQCELFSMPPGVPVPLKRVTEGVLNEISAMACHIPQGRRELSKFPLSSSS